MTNKAQGVAAAIVFWLMLSAFAGFIQANIGPGSWLMNALKSAVVFAAFAAIMIVGFYALDNLNSK